MGTLGAYLRTAREARGLDLRDAAQQTRISHAYLTAIEKEDFTKLPGEVFVKGFLKNYARFLGLPEDEVVKRYNELRTPAAPAPTAAPGTPKQEAPAPSPVRREPAQNDRSAEGHGRPAFEAYLWGALAIIICATLAFAIFPDMHSPKKEALPVHTAASATTPIVSTPTQTVRQDKLYLEVTALEDVWVLVRTDSSPQKKAVLKKGETVTWSADERFLVSFANAGAAKLQLNGKELVLNMPGKSVVRDLVVTATGIIAPKIEMERPKPRKPKPVVAQPPAAPQATATEQTPPAAPAGDVHSASPGTERPQETPQPSGAAQ